MAEEKTEEKKKKRKLSKKEIQNRQVMWVVILMTCLIFSILLFHFISNIFKNFINKFVYINLDWQKTKLGDLFFYSTRIPIADKQGQIISSYSMNFRNDPRKLDYVDLILEDGLITFKRDKTVYITLDPDMERCANNTIALINLAGFLRDFGGLKVKSAFSKSDYAKENNVSYVTCNNTPNNTVIYINSGKETKIQKINDNCYEIIYSNCEILPATEKFMLIILEHYMSYFTRESNSFLDMFK